MAVFFLGLMAGLFVGIVLMALMAAAKSADEQARLVQWSQPPVAPPTPEPGPELPQPGVQTALTRYRRAGGECEGSQTCGPPADASETETDLLHVRKQQRYARDADKCRGTPTDRPPRAGPNVRRPRPIEPP